MSRSGIRFRPPEVKISDELRWVLMRAFGPGEAELSGRFSAPKAVELAELFELGPRIAARQGHEQLAREIGEESAAELVGAQRDAIFTGLQRVAAARDLARLAAGLDLHLVFLKFLALHFSGALLPGSRDAADVDVLASANRLEEFEAVLRDGGYRRRDVSPSEHHLPILDHDKHGPVEVHRFIPGVVVGAGRSYASVDSLAASALLRPVGDLPGSCSVPAASVQTAHVIVHGIVQHGNHPDAYSAARVLADLIDLRRVHGARLLADAGAFIGQVVSEDEIAAAAALCDAVVCGRLPASDLLDGEEPEELLLRHVLAGALDASYRADLNLRFFSPRLTERPQAIVLGTTTLRAFFPTRGELAKIYGPPKGALGYAFRRVTRPIDVLWRLVRYSVQSVRLRFRRRRDRRR